MTTFELVEALGVRVIEVEALPEPILYIREYRLALVEVGLDDDGREAAADALLSAIADTADA